MSQGLCPSCGAAVNLTAGQIKTKCQYLLFLIVPRLFLSQQNSSIVTANFSRSRHARPLTALKVQSVFCLLILTLHSFSPTIYAQTNGFNEIKAKAEQGDAQAQFKLSGCYFKGDGVTKDYAEAIKWARKSAEQGNANGQASLGFLYASGLGVEKDLAEAFNWYRKAAEQGNAGVQNCLGGLYYEGKGVEKNYAEAARWFRKAAEQGNADGQNGLGVVYENGNGVEKDYAEAVTWYRKAAEQGNAAGEYNLGRMFFSGQGVEKDYAEAVKWSRKAAEQGDARGQQLLAQVKAEQQMDEPIRNPAPIITTVEPEKSQQPIVVMICLVMGVIAVAFWIKMKRKQDSAVWSQADDAGKKEHVAGFDLREKNLAESATANENQKTNTSTLAKCPFCKEEIQEGAIKCKHCGEILNNNAYGVVASKPAAEVQIPIGNLIDWLGRAFVVPLSFLVVLCITFNLLRGDMTGYCITKPGLHYTPNEDSSCHSFCLGPLEFHLHNYSSWERRVFGISLANSAIVDDQNLGEVIRYRVKLIALPILGMELSVGFTAFWWWRCIKRRPHVSVAGTGGKLSTENSLTLHLGFRSLDLGAKIILSSALAAFVSLFMPWVSMGIISSSGWNQQGYVFFLLFIYPVIGASNVKGLNKIGCIICGGLALAITIGYIADKHYEILGVTGNASGLGLYLFAVSTIGLIVGAVKYKRKP